MKSPLPLTPNTAAADRGVPLSEEAGRIASLVDKAAGLIQEQGRAAAFAEFGKKGTIWFTGDIYIFADDSAGNVLLNPAFPQHEGKNFTDQKDANGKILPCWIFSKRRKQGGLITCGQSQARPSHR